ncbi:Major facilitator superfamily domain-containing protein 10 [Eumeta japonica]|uniref:Major facilitator superfamily domain-containing protein 10 n=1 Tax=Eumeta variegata TaxID=151549 RepID=A0A4C1V9T8_EUMVA|nr:Major facilitator superfamily domain-containing protein 10 [Eumeta japonica]
MILPLLPSLLEYYDGQEGQGNSLYATLLSCVRVFQNLTGTPDRFASVLFGGVLGSMFSFLQFLASPIVGSLSDIYGRKPTLLICLLGIAFSHALWGYARTFGLFVLARFIGGLSKANVSLSMAVVTDASNDKTRARGMALVGLAFSIGFIIGPLTGAWFAKSAINVNYGLWGQRPAFCALALSLLNIALVYLYLPETLPKEKRAPQLRLSLAKAIDFVSPVHLLNFTAVKNLSEKQSGVMAVLQGGAARRLSVRGAECAARAALVLTPPSFLCVALAATSRPPLLQPLQWLWIGLILFAISTAFAVSCMTSAAAGQAPAAGRGAVLGCLRSLGALARAAGPLIASAVYWCSGAATAYVLGSIILIIPAVMLQRLKI